MVALFPVSIYSNNPNFIQNADHRSCPKDILNTLKAPLKSISLMRLSTVSLPCDSNVIGKGLESFLVCWLRCGESTHNLNHFPLGFGTNKMALSTTLENNCSFLSFNSLFKYSLNHISYSWDNWLLCPINKYCSVFSMIYNDRIRYCWESVPISVCWSVTRTDYYAIVTWMPPVQYSEHRLIYRWHPT